MPSVKELVLGGDALLWRSQRSGDLEGFRTVDEIRRPCLIYLSYPILPGGLPGASGLQVLTRKQVSIGQRLIGTPSSVEATPPGLRGFRRDGLPHPIGTCKMVKSQR